MKSPINDQFIEDKDEESGDNISDIWNIFLRRKKLVLISGILVFVSLMIKASYEKAFNSIYQGNFTLLTKDPIRGENNDGEKTFEKIALNNTETDIETLITFLKSPLLLKSLSEEFNSSPEDLSKRINISPGFLGQRRAKGILVVSVEGRDPVENTNLLNALSDTYLKTSLKQRQKRIADGLDFLNEQAPSIRAKVRLLQKELETFRNKYRVLDPREESDLIFKERDKLKSYLVNLRTKQKRFEEMPEQILSGSLRIEGFNDVLQTSEISLGQGVILGGNLPNIYKTVISLERRISEAKSKFLPNSKVLKDLEKSLEQLQPILKETQLNDLNSAIILNESEIENTKANIYKLSERLDELPVLIKEYEDILFRLNLAQLNLSGLINIR